MSNEIIQNNDSLSTVETIEKRIYTVRGEHVMIDRDLADLYGVENRSLRQSVRRNMEKFPGSASI